MLMHRALAALAGVLVLLVALVAYGLATTPAARADSGTVVGIVTKSLQNATYITTTTTTPRVVGSDNNAWLTKDYHAAELFVTADFTTTGVLTATVQSSPDGVNWVDGFYIADDGDVVNAQVVITNDGGGMIRYPLAGYYTRLSLVPSAGVTATVQMTLRNNGGS